MSKQKKKDPDLEPKTDIYRQFLEQRAGVDPKDTEKTDPEPKPDPDPNPEPDPEPDPDPDLDERFRQWKWKSQQEITNLKKKNKILQELVKGQEQLVEGLQQEVKALRDSPDKSKLRLN